MGECWRVKESRFRALSGVGVFILLSSESRDEAEDDRECSETVGLVVLLVDSFRLLFLILVVGLSDFVFDRKKVATR